MSDILGSFRKRAQDLIDSINSVGGLRSTVEGLRKQMAESDRRRAIHKARADLKQLDAQINEMITAVGVQAVGLHRAGRMTAPELRPLCEHIVELEAAVAQQREELARLEATLDEHKAIVEAIANGDRKLASKAAEKHMENSEKTLLKAMDAMKEQNAKSRSAKKKKLPAHKEAEK